jgi:hypothetical protein
LVCNNCQVYRSVGAIVNGGSGTGRGCFTHRPEFIDVFLHSSVGLQEMKWHKPWFDEECLGILDQRKQAKMQWI